MFKDEPALVIERYDRAVLAGGAIVRIHQEDVCQALSIMPDQKYTADGGPATADVLGILASTRRAEANLAAFTRMLFFNYLVGATDAHAKNYSLLLGGKDNVLLAPLYDVASGLAYEGLRRKGRLAMAIGGENRFGRVGSGAIRRYVRGRSDRQASSLEALGLTESWCTDVMAELAQAVPRAVGAVFDEAAAQPGADELRGRLEGPIAENCSQTLALL
jgi:serine/threonine-protein kinase HipA